MVYKLYQFRSSVVWRSYKFGSEGVKDTVFLNLVGCFDIFCSSIIIL